MKLANLRDEDLYQISLLKTRKGTATYEARRAAQILYTRHITRGGFGVGKGSSIPSHLDSGSNLSREWKSFEAVHGCSLSEYLAIKGN